MASPRLKQGFLQIDPQNVKGKEEVASSIKGAFKYGKPVEGPRTDALGEMPKPDLIITGCVAVDISGWRLGKGGGYGDIEVRRIKDQFGEIPVVTTIRGVLNNTFMITTIYINKSTNSPTVIFICKKYAI